MTTSLSQSQLPSASPPPSTFVMRTRAAVLADQSPEGDWVTVDGEQSEESYADLFLASARHRQTRLGGKFLKVS